MLRNQLEAYLLKAFSVHYDIETRESEYPLRALCAFHSRDSQYVLVHSVELWAAEHHEYLYLYSVEHLDLKTLEQIWQQLLSDGTPRVKPHAQHMYTYLTAIVLYDSADAEALSALKKLKQRREFKLSLHGWMESRIAAVDVSTAALTTNRAAKVLTRDFGGLVRRAISQCKERENKP